MKPSNEETDPVCGMEVNTDSAAGSYEYEGITYFPVRRTMERVSSSLILTAAFFMLAGCTGESVRVVLPDRHPANPSAIEAPFVFPADPFTGETPAPPPPAEKPAGHRDVDRHGSTDDDMRMDDDEGSDTLHGNHGMHGTGEKEGGR